ncbi:MAG TPA: PspC domain-containing protein, partial [Acidimicrobiales bacterium]|nr:PspC domain-containing protein [Acidimicrobiales bacterium]
MDPQAPGTTAPPPGAPTSPPPYRPPFETSGRKLRRSSSNRVIAGIAGGLAEYLGVDATPLRVVFVVVSCLFLGGGGGVVLYLLLWAIVPQAGAPAGSRRASSGRPWHDWDRPARSWAIVLGSLTLALIWSFGLGPGLHWSALPVLLLIGGLTVWLISRRRPGYWGGPGSHPAGPAYPYSGPGPYPGP